jgi:hypothetical protein
MNFNDIELEETVTDIVDSVVDIFDGVDEPILQELRSIASDFVSDFGFDRDYY